MPHPTVARAGTFGQLVPKSLGFGERPNPSYDLADWVLSHFTEEERKMIQEAALHCREIAELIIQGNIEKAMNLYNS